MDQQQQQIVRAHYVTFSQQLRDRATQARQRRDEAAWLVYTEAKRSAGPHPIYRQEELARVLEFMEEALWKAAGQGEDSVSIPFLDIPLLAKRNAYLEETASLAVLAKAELREAVNHLVNKFQDAHPEFSGTGGDGPHIMALVKSIKISW